MIDIAELRDAAHVLRGEAAGLAAMAADIPTELPEAPPVIAGTLCESLCRLRADLESIADELADQGGALDSRITQVENADSRWWQIGPGGAASGCCLPNGEMVTLSASGTATSSASGPGVSEPVLLGAATATSLTFGPGTAAPVSNGATAGNGIGAPPPGYVIAGMGVDPFTGAVTPIYQAAPPQQLFTAPGGRIIDQFGNTVDGASWSTAPVSVGNAALLPDGSLNMASREGQRLAGNIVAGGINAQALRNIALAESLTITPVTPDYRANNILRGYDPER
jgi:hypothetical protein